MAEVGGIQSDRLQVFIERLERLETERAGIASAIKDVFAEAVGSGFDRKAMRAVLKLRKMDRDDLQEQETLLDLYKAALGMET